MDGYEKRGAVVELVIDEVFIDFAFAVEVDTAMIINTVRIVKIVFSYIA